MKLFMLVFATLCCLALTGQSTTVFAAPDETKPILLPTPKKVTWLDGRVSLSTKHKAIGCVIDATEGQNAVTTGISQLNAHIRSLGGSVIPVVQANNCKTVLWVGTRQQLLSHADVLGDKFVLSGEMCVPDGYVIRCAKVGKRNVIICAGYDARGCYYGLQTLIQLMSENNGTVSIPQVDITDWPSFKMRILKIDSSATDPDAVARWTQMMPRYKMNMIATHFRPTAETGTWKQPSDMFQKNAEIIAGAGRRTDTLDPLLYIGPFNKNRGTMLDPQFANEYVSGLEKRIAQGFKWIAYDFNDWGTYEKLLPDEKAKFKDVGEMMTWLTNIVYNQLRPRYPDIGFISVPTAGYYGGLPKPELIYYCKNIPEDILVFTTGPITRSRDISEQWLKDWTAATGRKPIIWDNTIYSHLDCYYPIVRGCYNLNAYDNKFPANMPKLLSGGMHLNGTAQAWYEPGALTFLDYMWNPEAYDAKKSLRNAQILLWGKDAPDAVNTVQQKAINLYEYIFKARPQKGRGTIDETVEKYKMLDQAVKRLESVVNNPEMTRNLEEKCLDQAFVSIKRVFPEEQNLKAKFGLAEPSADKPAK